jgi:hypothetical protein
MSLLSPTHLLPIEHTTGYEIFPSQSIPTCQVAICEKTGMGLATHSVVAHLEEPKLTASCRRMRSLRTCWAPDLGRSRLDDRQPAVEAPDSVAVGKSSPARFAAALTCVPWEAPTLLDSRSCTAQGSPWCASAAFSVIVASFNFVL